MFTHEGTSPWLSELCSHAVLCVPPEHPSSPPHVAGAWEAHVIQRKGQISRMRSRGKNNCTGKGGSGSHISKCLGVNIPRKARLRQEEGDHRELSLLQSLMFYSILNTTPALLCHRAVNTRLLEQLYVNITEPRKEWPCSGQFSITW